MKACLGDSGVEVSIQPYKIPWGRGMGRPSLACGSVREPLLTVPQQGATAVAMIEHLSISGVQPLLPKKKKKNRKGERKNNSRNWNPPKLTHNPD